MASGLAAVTLLAAASPAGAATQLGETFTGPNNLCDPIFTYVQSASVNSSYTAPFDGVLTSWSHQADATPAPVKLKVARPAGPNTFTIVGESPLTTPGANQLVSSLIRVPMKAGDMIGILSGPPGNADCGRLTAGYSSNYRPSDTALGTTTTYSAPTTLQLDVAATLERDCDNDGFGDETQDPDTLSCPPGPTATYTERPQDKVKTKKKKANVTFEFIANELGATFNCVLDGQQEFRTCTSPLTVSVKKGEHTFSVIATDAGGNQGPAATDSFKVKRKKKK